VEDYAEPIFIIVSAILKNGNRSRTPEILKSFSLRQVRRCYVSSTHIPRGPRSSRISRSTRYVYPLMTHVQDLPVVQLQAMQKVQQRMSGASSPDQNSSGMQSSNLQSPVLGPGNTGQHPFAMSNPTALAYAAQMGLTGMNGMNMAMGMGMNPMLQMQMNMAGMGNMSAAFANPQTLQSVMRHPSPAPMGTQNYMGMGGMPGF
jgi:hypothetical protein